MSTLLERPENISASLGLRSLLMGRPVVAPTFAGHIKQARLLRRLTMGQVVARMHRLGEAFEGFTRAQLSRYEDGTTAAPDPVAVLQLCRLYDIAFEHCVEQLAVDRDRLATAGDSPPGRAAVSGHRARSG